MKSANPNKSVGLGFFAVSVIFISAFIFVFWGLPANNALGFACISVASGSWNNPNIWSNCNSNYPQSDDTVSIVSDHTVTLNIASASISGLNIDDEGTLEQAGASSLDINGSITLSQPGSGSGVKNRWLIDDGSATARGMISIGGPDPSQRVSKIRINSGTLLAKSSIVFNCTESHPENCVIDMNGGAGKINLKGVFGNIKSATLNAGNQSMIVFSDDTAQQTVPVNWGAGNYNDIRIKPGDLSAYLFEDITPSNVRGDIDVASGSFFQYGANITGNSSKSFSVDDNATFVMTGSASFPTGFGAFNFESQSTVRYAQNINTTISPKDYGFLEVEPEQGAASGSVNFYLAPGTTVTEKNFSIKNSNASGIVTVDSNTNNSSLSIGRNYHAGDNTKFIANTNNTLTINGDWNNSGEFIHSDGTVLLNGSGSYDVYNFSPSNSIFHKLIFNNPNGIWDLTGASLSVADTLTITNGVLDLNGKGLIVTGANLSNHGTLRLQGNEKITGLVMDTNSGTVEYDGVEDDPGYDGLAAGNDYFNLFFSGYVNHGHSGRWTAKGDDVDINGDLTIANGAYLDITGPDVDVIYIAGDMDIKGGTLHSTNRDVIFNGSGTNTLSAGNNNWLNDVTISTGDTRELGANLKLSGTTLVFGSLTSPGNNRVTVAGQFFCGGGCGTVNLSGGSMRVLINTTAAPQTLYFGPNDSTNNWTFGSLDFGVSGPNNATIIIESGGSGSFNVLASLSVGAVSTDIGKTFLNASNKTFVLSGGGTPFIVDPDGGLVASVSTFKYTSPLATTVTPATYYNLHVKPGGSVNHILGNGTFTVTNNLEVGDGSHTGAVSADENSPSISVGKNFSIANNSTFVAPGSGSAFTIGKDFTNSGNFSRNGGTITFNTTSNSVLSSPVNNIIFYNFTVATPGKTVKFTTGQTFRINGLFLLAGSSGNQARITSTTNGSRWFINYKGTQNITYTYIKDSGCDPSSNDLYIGTTTSGNTDGGNNDSACWIFQSGFKSGLTPGGTNNPRTLPPLNR